MDETEETKHFKFMTFLNLSSVSHKIGDDKLCEFYIKKAEEIIDDLDENTVLVRMYVSSDYVHMY